MIVVIIVIDSLTVLMIVNVHRVTWMLSPDFTGTGGTA